MACSRAVFLPPPKPAVVEDSTSSATKQIVSAHTHLILQESVRLCLFCLHPQEIKKKLEKIVTVRWD